MREFKNETVIITKEAWKFLQDYDRESRAWDKVKSLLNEKGYGYRRDGFVLEGFNI